MNNALISIIIPIYKVEPYLRRCLDSVVNQTYTNLEIILVDDGSPDDCPKICDEYASRDNRIIVIHKKNGGLSDARNAGLDICKGEYISFIDSDDWVERDYIEVLFNLLQKTNADIAVGNHQLFSEDGVVYPQNIFFDSVLDGYDATTMLIFKEPIQFVVSWCKLYKRNLFGKVRFPVGKIREDECTSYQFFHYSKIVSTTSKTLYHYLKRPDSIIGRNIPFDYEDILTQRGDFFLKNKRFDLSKYILSPIIWKKVQQLYNTPIEKNEKKIILAEIKTRFVSIEKNPLVPLYHKFLLRFIILFPNIYIFFKK